MVLINKIFISEIGIENLVFNQRVPHIELIDGEKAFRFTYQEIEEGQK